MHKEMRHRCLRGLPGSTRQRINRLDVKKESITVRHHVNPETVWRATIGNVKRFLDFARNDKIPAAPQLRAGSEAPNRSTLRTKHSQ